MRRLLLSGLIFYLSSLICVAQAPVGQILGSLRDPSGAVVPGASIVVTNLGTRQHFDTRTNEVGDYLIGELPPGEYSVTASMAGFQQVVRTPVPLVAFQNARVDLTLALGFTTDTVVVSAEIPQIDTRSNTLGDVVDTRTITEMPISNRNVVALVNLTPGVGHVSQGDNVNRNQQRLNIAGNRSYSTNMQLDGGSMYCAHRGQ